MGCTSLIVLQLVVGERHVFDLRRVDTVLSDAFIHFTYPRVVVVIVCVVVVVNVGLV